MHELRDFHQYILYSVIQWYNRGMYGDHSMQSFFADFARIADDESRHFGWCQQRLRELGYDYGCMPAHNLLWNGSELSSGELSNSPSVLELFPPQSLNAHIHTLVLQHMSCPMPCSASLHLDLTMLDEGSTSMHMDVTGMQPFMGMTAGMCHQ